MAELLEKLQSTLFSPGFSHINFHLVVLLFCADSLTFRRCLPNAALLISDQENASGTHCWFFSFFFCPKGAKNMATKWINKKGNWKKSRLLPPALAKILQIGGQWMWLHSGSLKKTCSNWHSRWTLTARLVDGWHSLRVAEQRRAAEGQ